MSATFSVTNTGCGDVSSIDWSVTTGAALVTVTSGTTSSTFSLKAGADSGVVKLSAMVTADGETCNAEYTFAVSKIEFLDAAKMPVDFLDIGHWGADAGVNALTGYTAANTLINDQNETFIDTDPDRFFVRVADVEANADPDVKDTIDLKLSTLNNLGAIDDNETTITLEETGSDTNVFESEALLLMSPELPTGDNPDDDVAVWSARADGVVADDVKDDRTHRATIDGDVHASYTPATGGMVQAMVPVTQRSPDMRKTLLMRIHVHMEPFNDVGVMTDGNPNTSVVGLRTVNGQIQTKTYAFDANAQKFGVGDGWFTFRDANGNMQHDPGEFSEPYADYSRKHRSQSPQDIARGDLSPNMNGDGWGPIASMSTINAQIERANIAWAQAGIKVVQSGPILFESPAPTPDPNDKPYKTIIHDGWFDVTGVGGLDGAIVAESEIAASSSPTLLEVVFTTALRPHNVPPGIVPLAVTSIPAFNGFLQPAFQENTYIYIGTKRNDLTITTSTALDIRRRALAHEVGHALTNLPDAQGTQTYIFFPFNIGALDNTPESRRRITHGIEMDARTQRQPGALGSRGNRLLTP